MKAPGRIQISIEQASATEIEADALVNPTNCECVMTDGIGAEITRKAGEDIASQAKERAPLAIGAALVTDAGALPVKHIIHAPIVEHPGRPTSTEDIRRGARAALLAASAKKFSTIVMPAMGTMSGGVAAPDAARAIVEEINGHKRDLPTRVIIADPREIVVETFQIAAGLLPPPH